MFVVTVWDETCQTESPFAVRSTLDEAKAAARALHGSLEFKHCTRVYQVPDDGFGAGVIVFDADDE